MTNITPGGFASNSRAQDARSDKTSITDLGNTNMSRSPVKQHPAPRHSHFAEHLDRALKQSPMAKPTALAAEKNRPPQEIWREVKNPTKQPVSPDRRLSKNEENDRPNSDLASVQRPGPSHTAPKAALKKTSMSNDTPPRPEGQAAATAQRNQNSSIHSAADVKSVAKTPSDPYAPMPANEVIPDLDRDPSQPLDLMMTMGNPELWMQQSPALALLAGHLELLEPAQIPNVVAQSPLLQSILGTASTAEVLQTARPMRQNLQILGLTSQDTPLLETPFANTPVKLAEALRSLGFDISRIVQEGDILKNSIALDGLEPYMQRAERLRSVLGLASSVAIPLAINANGPNQTISPSGKVQIDNLVPLAKPQTPVETAQLWSQVAEGNELTPLTVVDSKSEAPLFINPAQEPTLGLLNPVVDLGEKSNLDFTGKPDLERLLQADPRDSSRIVTGVSPKAAPVIQDPFQFVTQSWSSETVQTFKPEDLPNPEQLDSPLPQPTRSLDDLLHRQLIQAPDIQTRTDGTQQLLQEPTSLDISSLPQQLSELDSSSFHDQQGGDGSSRQQSQSFMSQDTNSMFGPSQNQTAIGQNKAFTIQTSAPQALAPMVEQRHLQEILDNSSMLIKEGGGSIRLDLGSKEMGPLDLALDIQGKTVALRIVTHSDQAREALVQELPKLRESLHSHHLNLDKVEIGLSYSSAWSQSSGNNRQNREQLFEDRTESSSRGPQGIRSTSRSYRQTLTTAPEARVPLHNGLIQVRV